MMLGEHQETEALLPSEKPRMIDLVAAAGFEVSQWADFAGGVRKAASNPKYCYEWCYEQEGMCLLNIWYENLIVENGEVIQRLNLRTRPSDVKGMRKVRAKRFDMAVSNAFLRGSNPRVVIQHRSKRGSGRVETRLLDPSPWTVTEYDAAKGDFILKRGIVAGAVSQDMEAEVLGFIEGKEKRLFVLHRQREAKLRKAKIEAFTAENDGRVFCEVCGCGFDFEEAYGELGSGFAHVHRLRPMAELPKSGSTVTLDDLAVVCPNCHAMIHRGGGCRSLEDVSPESMT